MQRELLPMCCVCETIRIDDETNTWLRKEDNPVLYNKFRERFGEKITHGYCPPCFEKVMKENETRKIIQSSQ